jgi:hypothetical protein
MEELSLEQAYEIVRLNLLDKGGLMHQAETGIDIDENSIQTMNAAIQRIQVDWRSLTAIPKNIAKLFFNVFPRLEKCIELYPSNKENLENLYSKFIHWVDALFAEEPLSEEAAIAIVSQQIVGLEPLALQIRFRHQIDENSLDLFLLALDRLVVLWQSREFISKLATGAMINAQDAFLELGDTSMVLRKQTLENVGQEVSMRIARCFGL